ncbi:MAG: sugar transferase [Patescibacteria group bacterium]
MLFLGDIFAFSVALFVALIIRFGGFPTNPFFLWHLGEFAPIFILWTATFLISRLYDRRVPAFRRKQAGVIIEAQIINSILAGLYFYFIPAGISPKAILLLDLVTSLGVILIFRIWIVPLFYRVKNEPAAFFASGAEFLELKRELLLHPEKYGFDILDLPVSELENTKVDSIIIDLASNKTEGHLSQFYKMIERGVRFVDVRTLYEEVFDKVPLSVLGESWFLQNISGRSRRGYDLAKRAMDLIIAIPLGVISLLIYPFIVLAIKLEDGGSIFIKQIRVGVNGRPVSMYKFRSMNGSDAGKDVLKSSLKITKVGSFLRKSRIDELPQIWNVIKGEWSLVGPRPELPALAELYAKEISYYDIRHLIKPGLSGWAQIYHDAHPHHGEAVDETREKLAYDLYYLKNRSFLLDLKIAFKTLKILATFAGR